MNFLSHFYFNRFTNDPQLVAGSVLPDLVRNADPSLKIHPEKKAAQLYRDAGLLSLQNGWKQHLFVDRMFHSSDFFKTQSNHLRGLLKPLFTDTPAKPFFVAHISLELLIDHLLIIHRKVDVAAFYRQLEQAPADQLLAFLALPGAVDASSLNRVARFYHRFCQNAYLHSYHDLNGVAYAVAQICRQIWPEGGITKQHERYMCTVFGQVIPQIEQHYEDLFSKIQYALDSVYDE